MLPKETTGEVIDSACLKALGSQQSTVIDEEYIPAKKAGKVLNKFLEEDDQETYIDSDR